ncbi:MAG: hypothetical protein PWQ22_273 [Archaeoglobaceae archaeon]|nr:hypothetical protein [Archaeoglobaceae archaeon]MDK2875863.1 hypothetical protein [Archaeoglobaceae archaeon]
MEMLRLEFDLQHHLVLSRKNASDHALIRLILSTLATTAEIANLSKRDLRRSGKRYFVQLFGEKCRISPLDEQTFKLISEIQDEKPYKLKEEEIDKIVSRYSPKDRKYTAKSLRRAMITFLKDSALFEVKFESLDFDELEDFMNDFNPLFSGVWLEEEGLRDFILNYSTLNNISDPKIIAEETGIDESFVASVLRSEKSIFSLAKKYDSERFIF